jgi:hypothetical protein
MRHAPRPTQNFIVTAVFREMRDRLGFEQRTPDQPIDATFADALRWLRATQTFETSAGDKRAGPRWPKSRKMEGSPKFAN